MASSRTTKTVYLIRHAESAENVLMQGVVRSVNAVKQFSFPSLSDLKISAQLCSNMVTGGNDECTLSPNGQNQVNEVHQLLLQDRDSIFGTDITKHVAEKRVLVAHSPMLRAKQTCEGLTQDLFAPHTVEFVQLETLREIVPVDYVNIKRWYEAKQRVTEFESWLNDRPEDIFVVVGHSHYFKHMLGVDFKFSNCEVWKSVFQVNCLEEENPTKRWQDLQRLCGSSTAQATFGAEGPENWKS